MAILLQFLQVTTREMTKEYIQSIVSIRKRKEKLQFSQQSTLIDNVEHQINSKLKCRECLMSKCDFIMTAINQT